jgi:DNA-binding NarL/FixJ family response regulator
MEADKIWGLLLTDDLIFSSRITGTAQGLGLKIIAVKSVGEIFNQADVKIPTCVILDLGFPGLQLSDLIRSLKDKVLPMPRLVAYGSHVDAAGLKAARDAGCDIVLPRSRFVEELPLSLPEWLMPPS